MKITEFKQAIKDIGFHNGKNLEVTDNNCEFYIESDTEILAAINKSGKCLIATNYQNFFELEEGLRQTLFDVIFKFASTPIEERQEEKKYYLTHRFLVEEGDCNYLNYHHSFEKLYLSGKSQTKTIQTQFTQTEIDEIKEKYHTDLKDFEIIEVKE